MGVDPAARGQGGRDGGAGAKTQRNPSEGGGAATNVGKKKGARETSGGRRGVKYSAWGSLFLMLSLPACFGFLLFTVLDLLGLGLFLGLFHSRWKGGMCRPARDFSLPEPPTSLQHKHKDIGFKKKSIRTFPAA
jgi:hypothetical protein